VKRVALLTVGMSAVPLSMAAQEESRLEALVEAYTWTAQVMGVGDLVGAEQAGKALDLYRTLADGYELLTDNDRGFEPDLSPAGMPRVPSNCAESEECGVCYEEAQGKLNRVRGTFEELRSLGLQTKEMKDDALAVGESFSSIQGFGLGWYGARRDIMAGWQNFLDAYDAKYRELLESLRNALEQIETCEADHFAVPDWYDRYGFIYYQFMEERYHPGGVLD